LVIPKPQLLNSEGQVTSSLSLQGIMASSHVLGTQKLLQTWRAWQVRSDEHEVGHIWVPA
jgi:hypothetical protein